MKRHSLSECPELADFLRHERPAVIALPIDKDEVHAAAILFSHSEDPLRFYYVTDRRTEKCRLLAETGAVNGSCVIGATMNTPFTLQMRGRFEIVDPVEYATAVESYYDKRGNRKEDVDDPYNVLICFSPHWARFTDYSQGYDRYMLELEEK